VERLRVRTGAAAFDIGCAAIFGSKRILANMKRIFIRFKANTTGFIVFIDACFASKRISEFYMRNI
jgi:hypothetical protein